MEIKILQNAEHIIESFMNHFVMSWDEFQVKQKEWIEHMAETNYHIDLKWYEQSYRWDRMNPEFPRTSMNEALSFLREHSGCVLFMSEKGEDTYYRGKKLVDFVAEADVQALATQIEKEWFDSYKLAELNMYDPDAFLPEDLYVFDWSMKWCVVFTHETIVWESQTDNPMKAAESRYCIICKL